MKYIKQYEINNIKFLDVNKYFKKYVLYGDPNNTLFFANVEEIKEYTPSLIYVKFNIIVRYVNLIAKEINAHVTLKPEWPVEDLKRNLIFQSDNKEEVQNYIKMLKDQNKFNL